MTQVIWRGVQAKVAASRGRYEEAESLRVKRSRSPLRRT